ncbi:MAG: hypothetical protein FWE47_00560 [Oscillospiraceae bacterium]|nr:hypothetical protein [Oscillospiraceae bacterium]
MRKTREQMRRELHDLRYLRFYYNPSGSSSSKRYPDFTAESAEKFVSDTALKWVNGWIKDDNEFWKKEERTPFSFFEFYFKEEYGDYALYCHKDELKPLYDEFAKESEALKKQEPYATMRETYEKMWENLKNNSDFYVRDLLKSGLNSNETMDKDILLHKAIYDYLKEKQEGSEELLEKFEKVDNFADKEIAMLSHISKDYALFFERKATVKSIANKFKTLEGLTEKEIVLIAKESPKLLIELARNTKEQISKKVIKISNR